MVKLNVEINDTLSLAVEQVQLVTSPVRIDRALREAALSLLVMQVARIHGKGVKSDGQPIGQYSRAYLRKRLKAGLRGRKIVLRFTSQMQNDFKAGLTAAGSLKAGPGEYTLGFSNALNAKKANWLQEKFGPIYAPTRQEEQTVIQTITERLTDALR